jgi:dTDP-4-amino-4,6-dideoxygalactose transaminase
MPVPLLDLHAQYVTLRPELEAAVRAVFASQRFILGPEVEQLEAEVAHYSGCEFGIGMSSGTDALLAALMAEGIGPGDEVITPPFSFFATAGVVHRLGARPVFVDIEPDTFNLDPTKLEAAVTSRTRAIIAVHLFGQMADMDAVMEVASRRGLCVIEDAAQSIGAELAGRRAGSIGDYGCLSFFPSKNLGAAGDAGMVVCRDPARADRLRLLRSHGSRNKYFHDFVGGNFRIDALQAAILRVKLPHLDGWTAKRAQNARFYRDRFAKAGRVVDRASQLARGTLVAPIEAPSRRHVYNQFVIRVKDRDGLRAHLDARGIGSEVYYPLPFHLQECFRYLGHGAGAFAVSEQAAAEVLALPIYPELTAGQLEEVASAVLEHLASTAR